MKSLRQSLHKQDLLGLGIMVILFVVFYFLFDEEILDDYWETNVILILINIIMAVSLNLINGLTGQFSIGHAGFMAVGAYTSAIITVKLGMDFPIALIVATVSAAFLGFLIGMPTLRLNGDYLAIATLGTGGNHPDRHPEHRLCGRGFGFMGIPRLTTFPIAFWIMVFVVYFIKNFKNSADGRACLAIRENEIAAETMGINTTKYKVMAFTIGAGFAGTAGAPVFPLLLHCPPGFLYLHAVFRRTDHGGAGRSGLHQRIHFRCRAADGHFRCPGGLSGMADGDLFHRTDRPDAEPATGDLWQQGTEPEDVPIYQTGRWVSWRNCSK